MKEILRNTNLLSSNKAYHDFVVELGDKLVRDVLFLSILFYIF